MQNATVVPENNKQQAPWLKPYMIGFVICMITYTVFLVGSLLLMKNFDLGIWQLPIGLAPALPMSILVWVYMRALARMDEFVRHIHVRSILFAAAVTTVCSLFVAFFENAGLPPLTFHVWVLMCGSWGIALCYNSYKFR